ncbi:MAG: hypothetical protein H6923_01395 [Alphaproteobacteria bacterium]|nr:hypothetical protein [Alphaproteobacteria bacterium]
MSVAFHPVWEQNKRLLAGLAVAWLGVALASNFLMQTVPDRTEGGLRPAASDPYAALTSSDEMEGWLKTIYERAVFFADRRIPTPAEAGDLADDAPVAAGDAAGLMLYGTFVGQTYAAAILGGGGLERPTLLGVGDRVGSARIAAITRGKIALEGPGGRSELVAEPRQGAEEGASERKTRRKASTPKAPPKPANIRMP